MFDTEFEAIAQSQVSFYPEEMREDIDRTIDTIYQPTRIVPKSPAIGFDTPHDCQ